MQCKLTKLIYHKVFAINTRRGGKVCGTRAGADGPSTQPQQPYSWPMEQGKPVS